MNNKIVKLCRGHGCCPEINIDFSNGTRDLNYCEFVLSDDYGNIIIFIKDDFENIINEINEILKSVDYNIDVVPDDEQEDIEAKIKNHTIKMKPFQFKMLKDYIEVKNEK